MKKTPRTLMAVTLISGIILGISITGLFSFTNAVSVPVSLPAVNKISVQQANTFFKNYYNSATPSNGIFQGFALNRDQLSALNNLLTENPSLSGFRIYMGSDNSNGSVGIVVGINNSGKDVTASIYQTIAGGSGPCPTICDASSNITAK